MNNMFLKFILGKPPANVEAWIKAHYNPGPDLSKPLCFTAVDAGAVIALKCNGNNLKAATFETSVDGQTWTDYTYATNITLANAGDKVYFRAKADNIGIARTLSDYLQFTTTQNAKLVDVSGNVMSLLAPEFKDLLDLSTIKSGSAGTYEFYKLFQYCENIKSCKDLTLSATTLADSCYDSMFNRCTSLTAAPQLPATKLASYCYSYMFYNCTSLTSAPQLPATLLASYCYDSMFYNCTSLTSAPQLPATLLASYCYYRMFYGCTSLTAAPELPATTLASDCYYRMFYGCTSLTAAPELPATTLASDCYYGMFYGCTRLSSINVNFSVWSPSSATSYWLNNVANTGTFTCPATLPQTRGADNIPNKWTIVTK